MDDEIQIETTTDAAAIAEARRLAPESTTLVDRLVLNLPSGPDDPRLARATPEDRSEFLLGLERVAANAGAPGHRREGALRLLLSLAPERGWSRVEALLESPETPARCRGLLLAAVEPGGRGPSAIARALSDPDPEVQETALGLARVRFSNAGDYYHVRAVEAAANAALRDAGRPERFQRLVTGDQTAALLFADPDLVGQATQRLLLATEDAGAAVAAAVDRLA